MTTSSSYTFDPTVAGTLDEAFERAGIDPATISHRHIASAKMSLNLMFTEWVARDGDALYRVVPGTSSVSASTTYFSPQSGTYDLIDVVCDYNSSGVDLPLYRMSRQDYLLLPDNATTGQPRSYYVDQSNLNAPRAYLYPVPDAACSITYDALRYMQTPGLLSETLDVHRPWLEAMIAGLAYRLALKYNLDRVSLLKPLYEESYALARRAGSGASQITISGRGFGSSGRMRRLAT